LKEIHSWRDRFVSSNKRRHWGTSTEIFNLENGKDLLKRWFQDVKLVLYPDHLHVTEVEPLLLYINSYLAEELDPSSRKELEDFLKNIIKEHGAIKITKETGLFTAVKR
jgi:hypothetical protein